MLETMVRNKVSKARGIMERHVSIPYIKVEREKGSKVPVQTVKEACVYRELGCVQTNSRNLLFIILLSSRPSSIYRVLAHEHVCWSALGKRERM